ncbi:MAG: beta-galactosidase trimerization domain-containing protein [Planctomycetota bacterium]|nr:beta-galactosidase trimerization domain-containing protein [Planctomycetota bacterium]
MQSAILSSLLSVTLLCSCSFAESSSPHVVVAEGEKFVSWEGGGWRATHQDDTYASHSYGGMWMTHGGCLGAPSHDVNSLAILSVNVPADGDYRVWSKYQAMPYFSYLHKIEIVQNGKKVYSHVYGSEKADRLWSFSAKSNVLWWPWGVDHDAAEAPAKTVKLTAGTAEIGLITVKNPDRGADRFIDFVVLTTSRKDTYLGHKPYRVGSPFTNEAFAATRVYMRFQNRSKAPAKITLRRAGHYQPSYGGASASFPEIAVAPDKWSNWFNFGPFCRLVHNEGLWLSVKGADVVPIQIAQDVSGQQMIGDLKVPNGEAINIPIDITWNPKARVKTSRQLASELIEKSKTWRKANSGRKPRHILFYGAFRGKGDWVMQMKDALGYNTMLPDKYEHVKRDGYHTHAGNEARIKSLAASLKEKENFRVLSFGDEIHLGRINYKDPNNLKKFHDWLDAKKLKKRDLGVKPEDAPLLGPRAVTNEKTRRLVWYSQLFNEEERFAHYRSLTELAQKVIGPHVLTGANYSPHHLALCYGPVYKWVDIFKHQGMSMFWTEDYIFSVPEAPQIISWMFAQIQCGVKYHNQPVHFYVMPHAPGQLPGFLRRNMIFSVGAGALHIDNFWIGPQENFTENYVAWGEDDTFKALHDAIYETAEVEPYLIGSKPRPAQVAIILSKATDFNESRLMIEKSKDPLAADSRNAPEKLNQILCRKDQQMLYLALRHTQHEVDLITEDDIVDLDILDRYKAVYFAGEWVDNRILKPLKSWVRKGGVFFATAGLGHRNQFDEPEEDMLDLLGLKAATLTKNAVIIRTQLELPVLPAIDTMDFKGAKIEAIGMKQVLTTRKAKPIAHWPDGTAAATVYEYGKGKAIAVGTLAGNTHMRTAVKAQPWPRGGRKSVYNPVDFSEATTRLVRLGIEPGLERQVECSNPFVEAIVRDSERGTLVTLINWTNQPVNGLKVKVRLPAIPVQIRSVSQNKSLGTGFQDGFALFQTDLKEADFVVLQR